MSALKSEEKMLIIIRGIKFIIIIINIIIIIIIIIIILIIIFITIMIGSARES